MKDVLIYIIFIKNNNLSLIYIKIFIFYSNLLVYTLPIDLILIKKSKVKLKIYTYNSIDLGSFVLQSDLQVASCTHKA